jgi:acyl-CoA thioester hydrolase
LSFLKIEDDHEEHTGAASRVYETSLRVRYAETDQMGVVYHSNYIVWFEVGRVEMLRELGFHYREMEKQDGTHIAVVEARCRFKAPALYDDLITIRTRLLNVRESLLHFGYEVVRSRDGALLAEGETVHLVVDDEFKRIRLPEKYLRPFLQAAGKNLQESDEPTPRGSVAN